MWRTLNNKYTLQSGREPSQIFHRIRSDRSASVPTGGEKGGSARVQGERKAQRNGCSLIPSGLPRCRPGTARGVLVTLPSGATSRQMAGVLAVA